MRLRALVWGIVAAVLVGACVLQFTGRSPLQANIMAMLPPTERNPLAEEVIQRLGELGGTRSVFLVGHASPERAKYAARAFVAQLRRHEVFRRVQAELPPVDAQALFGVYAPHRFHLLTAEDRRQLAQGEAAGFAGRLLQQLHSPIRYGVAAPLVQDPFGFFNAYLSSLPFRNLTMDVEDGLLMARDRDDRGGRVYVLVTAELAGSAHDPQVQEQAAAALAAAEQELHSASAGGTLLRTGTVYFAGAARQAAQSEIDVIGWGSLAGISVLLLLAFRSLRPLILGLVSVAVGIAAAALAVVAVHGELHLLTLVFGASLIGEAIDYSIQLFAARLGMQCAWDAEEGLKRVLPGLVIALVTSLLGYAALALPRFPALSQIALFAAVGLSAAFLTTVLLLPALLRRPQAGDTAAVLRLPGRLLAWWRAHVGRGAALALLAGLLLVSAPGWLRLQAEDDIRLLISPSPALLKQEADIRRLTGTGNSSQFFLVEGPTVQSLLEREEALVSRLNESARTGELSHVHAVTEFVPSAARQGENYRLLARASGGEVKLRAVLSGAGFRDEAIAAYLADFRRAEGAVLAPQDWLAAPVSAPFRHLWVGRAGQGYASIVIPFGFTSVATLEKAAVGLPGVTVVDKAASVSQLFRRYRELGLAALGVAMALVYVVLWFRYGGIGSLVVLMPTALAVGGTLAVFGYAGVPMTFFSVMALMLVLGVGVNYSVFLREGGPGAAATLVGVVLSALTTLLSFGLLALSSTPALQRFGLTLLVGVGLAVVLAPTILSLAPARQGAGQ